MEILFIAERKGFLENIKLLMIPLRDLNELVWLILLTLIGSLEWTRLMSVISKGYLKDNLMIKSFFLLMVVYRILTIPETSKKLIIWSKRAVKLG